MNSRALRLQKILIFMAFFLILPVGTALAAKTLSSVEILQIEISVGQGRAEIPLVKGLPSKMAEKEVNSNIKAAIESMVNPLPGSALSGAFKIVFFNDYLLVVHFTGYTKAPGSSYAERVDAGLHVDLMTGRVYELRSLFDREIDYAERILELCRGNSTYYRLAGGSWDYDDFASIWKTGEQNRRFLLTDNYLRVYTVDDGVLSGYGIPYSDMEDILDKDGALWVALMRSTNKASGLAFYEAPMGWNSKKQEPGDDLGVDNPGKKEENITAAKASEGTPDVLVHDNDGVSWNAQSVEYDDTRGALLVKGYFYNNTGDIATKVRQMRMNLTLKDSLGNVVGLYSATFRGHAMQLAPGDSTGWTYKLTGVRWHAKYASNWDINYTAKYALSKVKK